MRSIVLNQNGVDYPLNSQADLRKAMGVSPGRTLLMTDETGALIAAGNDVQSLQRSAPLIKALQQPEKRVMLKATSPTVRPNKVRSSFETLCAELDAIRKTQRTVAA